MEAGQMQIYFFDTLSFFFSHLMDPKMVYFSCIERNLLESNTFLSNVSKEYK